MTMLDRVKGLGLKRFWIGLCLKIDEERQKALNKIKQTNLATDSSDSSGSGDSEKGNSRTGNSFKEGEKSVESEESVANFGGLFFGELFIFALLVVVVGILGLLASCLLKTICHSDVPINEDRCGVIKEP